MRLLLCLALLSATASSQTPDTLAKVAVTHLRAAWNESAHYTYLDTEHDHSFIDSKFNQDRTKVSETIFLEGAPYTRLISVDGKPLTGKALAHEQAMYDQAVRERRSVSDVKADQKRHFQHTIADELDPANFDHRLVGHATIDGHACLLLLFEPKASATPIPTRKFTFWIDERDHQVLRYEQELLTTQNNILAGSIFSYRFAWVEGFLLPSETHMDLSWDEPAMRNKRIHLLATHTFSNYRRFRTSVTIGPATVVPENQR